MNAATHRHPSEEPTRKPWRQVAVNWKEWLDIVSEQEIVTIILHISESIASLFLMDRGVKLIDWAKPPGEEENLSQKLLLLCNLK